MAIILLGGNATLTDDAKEVLDPYIVVETYYSGTILDPIKIRLYLDMVIDDLMKHVERYDSSNPSVLVLNNTRYYLGENELINEDSNLAMRQRTIFNLLSSLDNEKIFTTIDSETPTGKKINKEIKDIYFMNTITNTMSYIMENGVKELEDDEVEDTHLYVEG